MIKDKGYLYYVVYILSVTLTQATFRGYTFKYLWPENPKFEIYSIILMSIFVGAASIEFLRIFVNTRKYVPKLDKLFFVAHVIYALTAILTFMGFYQIAWLLILFLVSPLSLFMLYVGVKVSYVGYRPAKFFTVAWAIFLVGVFVYAMKDLGILPYNNITVYTMLVGSAIETVLLSFALADRINILKQEKLAILEVNQQLITDQNITLEKKVRERTLEIEMQKKKIEAQRKEQVKSLKYKALTAQMNPHFIFNALNSIRSFVLNNDAKQADKFLTKFAKLMRSMLDSSREDYRLLSQEVEVLNNYLSIEQLRFDNQFSYTIEIAEDMEMDDIRIPSFLIQPYVENAIIHGVMNREDGEIKINFSREDNCVLCVIEDNGCGIQNAEVEDKQHKSVSMSITKERLASIGLQSDVNIIDLSNEDGAPCGTRVEVLIDIK